jgi:imidazolonepropionase-like amidohydrolase
MLRSAWNARKHLESGVTTARDNGAKNMTAMYLKQGIERGFIPGPRMVISGRPVTITGGHCWPMNGEADGVEGVREAVRRLIKEGVDWIKVMTTGGGTRTSYSNL